MTVFEQITTPTLLFADALDSSFVFEAMQNEWISVLGIPGCNVAQYPEQKVHNALAKILEEPKAQIILAISVHSEHLCRMANGENVIQRMNTQIAMQLQKGLKFGTESLFWLLAVKAYLAERLQDVLSWPAIHVMEQTGKIAVRAFVINEQKNVVIEVVAHPPKEEAGFVNSLKRLKNERF